MLTTDLAALYAAADLPPELAQRPLPVAYGWCVVLYQHHLAAASRAWAWDRKWTWMGRAEVVLQVIELLERVMRMEGRER